LPVIDGLFRYGCVYGDGSEISPHGSSEGNLPMSCSSAWAILKNRRQCPFGSSLTQDYEKIGNALF
jgi:hypothetical protein